MFRALNKLWLIGNYDNSFKNGNLSHLSTSNDPGMFTEVRLGERIKEYYIGEYKDDYRKGERFFCFLMF